MGVLVSSSDGSAKPAGLCLTVGIPLIATGRYHRYQYYDTQRDEEDNSHSNNPRHIPFELIVGLGLIVVALVLTLSELFSQRKTKQQQHSGSAAEKKRDRWWMFRASSCEIADKLERSLQDESLTNERKMHVAQVCLDALSNRFCYRQQHNALKGKEATTTPNHTNDNPSQELELICQTAAYQVLRLLPTLQPFLEITSVTSSALSLLALVAKHDTVRQRFATKEYGFHIPIQAMRTSLTQAKLSSTPTEDDEQRSAELQRRACLFLGSSVDGNIYLATRAVSDANALESILDALDWYRHHADVANWALWAVFVVCYEHGRNKGQLVSLKGVHIVCEAMKNIPNCKEVQRHGVAILFDLLREVGGGGTQQSCYDNLAQVRTLALAAGMHDIVKCAMEKHKDSMEIVMMGREMLVATGYRGEIPSCEAALAVRG